MNRTAAIRLLCALGILAFSALNAESVLAADPGDSAACMGCHSGHAESYAATKHGQKGNDKGPNCQTCHGEGAAHIKAGGGRGVGGMLNFTSKSVPAEQKSAVCLTCHEGSRHLAFWDSGKHKKNDVSCNSCHSLHGPPGPGAQIALQSPNPKAVPLQTTSRQLQFETCTSCHKQIRSQLTKPSHHPIIEGKVACTDCHNPHGALSKAMVKGESIPQLCTSCHTEKRGPFIWEHPPVEENCLTCHNSHGSNHNRLLAEKAPNVCQDCHDAAQHPGTVYGGQQGWNFSAPASTPNTRLIARGCVNCHNNLHGSNAPGNRGKAFLR